MPPALPWLVLIVAIAAAVKLSLWYFWARKLHARHGARHSFGSLFTRFVGGRIRVGGKPLWYRKHHMDEALWDDFQPLQWWNLITSLLLLVVLYFAFSMVIGHFRP